MFPNDNVMKRISWITGDYYIDVDLPIIAELCRYYDIYWQVVITPNNTLDHRKMVAEQLGENPKNVVVRFVQLLHRGRSILSVADYWQIVSRAKKFCPHLYYIAFVGMPFALPIFRFRLPIRNCVVACHNVSTPKGAGAEHFARIYTKLWLSTFCNIQVFSEGQKKILNANYSGKQVLCAPLAIKNYGNESKERQTNHQPVTFLFFGNIVQYKRLDILIDAANQLYDQGFRNFRVKIAGSCQEWNIYEPMLQGREIFETDIRRIPNEGISRLFDEADYFMMPYQDIAQSGAMMVAINYRMPVIASDLPAFHEILTEGENALFFEPANSSELASLMKRVINDHHNVYPKLVKNVETLRRLFLPENICKTYHHYFGQLSL